MPSLFERISKNLVKEIGAEDLRPVRSLQSANKYRVLSILRKKRTCSQFWQSPDVPVEYTLMDFLEPGSSVPGTVNKGKGARSGKRRCSQAVRHARVPEAPTQVSVSVGFAKRPWARSYGSLRLYNTGTQACIRSSNSHRSLL